MGKTRPIIFTTESVRAILDGRKTMTRRVIVPQPYREELINGWNWVRGSYWQKTHGMGQFKDTNEATKVISRYCPYGQVGDRLWVRETWATEKLYDDWKPADIPTWAFISYKASKGWGGYIMPIIGKTRASIFLTRWFSRLTLEITGVRVERLQDISDEDIKREGVTGDSSSELLAKFQGLWNIINIKRGYGWNKNPWVWVTQFDNIRVRVK